MDFPEGKSISFLLFEMRHFLKLQPLLQKAAQQLRTGVMLFFGAEKTGANGRQTVQYNVFLLF